MRSSLIPTCLLLTSFMVTAVAADEPGSKAAKLRQEHGSKEILADPCLPTTEKEAMQLTAPWRAKISRDVAFYVIQRVNIACTIIVNATEPGAMFEPQAPKLLSILRDLRADVLAPLYRAHPDLKGKAAGQMIPTTIPHANKQEIGRGTAEKLIRTLSAKGSRMLEIATEDIGQATNEDISHAANAEAAEAMLQPILDAEAELSFAAKVGYDAYPDLFKKLVAMKQPPARTSESDANFRKGVPPLGSVKLSETALAFVKDFKQQLSKEEPSADPIMSIDWILGGSSKGPADATWTHTGPGLQLGALWRSQLPPDIIDNVGGIEIIFSAPDPSIFVGKTIDLRDGKFFIRD